MPLWGKVAPLRIGHLVHDTPAISMSPFLNGHILCHLFFCMQICAYNFPRLQKTTEKLPEQFGYIWSVLKPLGPFGVTLP